MGSDDESLRANAGTFEENVRFGCFFNCPIIETAPRMLFCKVNCLYKRFSAHLKASLPLWVAFKQWSYRRIWMALEGGPKNSYGQNIQTNTARWRYEYWGCDVIKTKAEQNLNHIKRKCVVKWDENNHSLSFLVAWIRMFQGCQCLLE